MSLQDVRVRFAPSPTGYVHIGNLRAALFNWLFARHHQGAFLVRLEDTDQERFKQEYVDDIIASLDWLNINPDEPVASQTERVEEHKRMIVQLVEQGKAYRCFCTHEELDKRRAAAGQTEFFRYDGLCRERTDAPEGKPAAIRFRLPDGQQEVVFDDLIRGTIRVGFDQLDDFIIARSDGSPMYNFVVVMDDAHMRISHVIRGEDHISNTPKQLLLYQACGFTAPQFAHVPLILGPSGAKLSKREAATAVREYKQAGYLPDALFNYLVRLGWSHGDQEIFTRDELISYFSLEHIGKGGAIFDQEKLDWVNGVHMRNISAPELLSHLESVDASVRATLADWSDAQVHQFIDLYKERANTLVALAHELRIVCVPPTEYAQDDVAKWITPETEGHLKAVIAVLEAADFTADALAKVLKGFCKERGFKLGAIAQPLRIALVGKTVSPGIFALLSALGKDESLARVRTFMEKIYGI